MLAVSVRCHFWRSGGPVTSSLRLHEKWGHGGFLSPWASPFLRSPHCARQKAPLLEPEKISADHRRAAQTRLHASQAPMSSSETQGRGGKVAGVGLDSGENEWGRISW